jgi:hypothetical protein
MENSTRYEMSQEQRDRICGAAAIRLSNAQKRVNELTVLMKWTGESLQTVADFLIHPDSFGGKLPSFPAHEEMIADFAELKAVRGTVVEEREHCRKLGLVFD